MIKKKYFLLTLLCATVLSLTGCGEDKSTYKEPSAYNKENSKSETISNNALELSVDGDTSTFVLKDKVNGKEYRSNPSPEDIEKYANAKGQLKEVLSSTMTLVYTNSTDTQKELNNYSASIADGNFEVKKINDKEIDVNYTIGDMEKLFICPLVIKTQDMDALLKKMKDSDQKTVIRNYVKYDYKELEEDDDEEKMQMALEKFPDLKSQSLYYLSEDITDSKASNLERIFTGVGYTEEQRNKDMEGYNVSRNSGKPIFNITIQYILDDEDLVVKVPMEKINYNPTYPLAELSFLPYMCAGNTDEEGFVLVPEGTGGIINFNNGKTGQQTYLNEVYGWDYGLSRDVIIDETKASFPVIGISNSTKSSSMICIAEEGSAYSSVKADIAGKENGYNYGKFVYKMVHGENMSISTKTDTTVRTFEASLPKETLTQRYKFSNKTDYVSMAQEYREYLTNRYPTLVKKEEAVVPMGVELIGAVDNIEHVLGYPVTRSLALTKYSQAEDILKQLKSSGVENLNAKYTGWFNTGVKQKSAIKVKTVNRLGSQDDLKALTTYAESTAGLDLYMNGKFMYVMKTSLFDGFNTNRDAAKFCSREICELYTVDPIIFAANEDSENSELYYLVKPSYTMESIDNFMSAIKQYGVKNIGFEDVGNNLAADYNPKSRVSREAVMKMEADKMKSIKESGSKIMTASGNEYAIPYSDMVTDLNIAAKDVNIIDESVPFYQIALHGLVDYTGSAINLSADKQEMILRSAETGAGLFYTFISEPTSALQDTDYTQYYACNFLDWKDDAIELYKRFNNDLKDTFNQFIVGHQKVANGIYKTTYENGKTVLVNYNYADYDYNGTTVPQRDFVVMTGGGK